MAKSSARVPRRCLCAFLCATGIACGLRAAEEGNDSRTGAGGRVEEGIAILPARITLAPPLLRHRLLVERIRGRDALGAFPGRVEWEVSDPGVARIVEEGGAWYVEGLRDGRAAVRARAGGLAAEAAIEVRGAAEPVRWSFRNHVEPVLAKAGCSSGACHGAQAGKNGFKLSLRGYDPAGDHLALTRDARARRVVVEDPAASLVLLKPAGIVPHKGGVRFAVDSLEFRVLAEWIAWGAPPPQDDDPRLVKLSVHPEASLLPPGAERSLIASATYSDGRTEDVTRWAKFTSADRAVAQVDEGGRVRVMGPGEGAITVWYSSRIAVARISVPYPNAVPPERFAAAERHNWIDDLILAKLRRLKIAPSPLAGDATFIRRVYLDTLGILPEPEEVRRFLKDPAPYREKRKRLIAEALERSEFVDYWSYKFSDLLLVSSESLPKPAVWAFYRWIRDNVANNTPWDEFVRRLLTARGSTLENGAANFFALHKEPQALAETASTAFLGLSINCARCHNHPLEKWTNDQYYGMANLFSRVRLKRGGRPGEEIVFDVTWGELVQPLTGRPQPPRPLEGEALPFEDPRNRRAYLAAWLTSPENPLFARAIANRIWANFMGVGLVEPVDDLRETNPASNEELLSRLAAYLVENGYDLKELMRVILESAAYQRASEPVEGNAADSRFYARYYPRRLMAEAILDAFSQVTEVPSTFPGYPRGWRALQLPDANVSSYFLRTFGRPERKITCECERASEPSMAQVLHLANGDTLNEKLRAQGNRLDRLLRAGKSAQEILDELYLAALARHPTGREREALVKEIATASPPERRAVLEDIIWSLLTSREFLFNH